MSLKSFKACIDIFLEKGLSSQHPVLTHGQSYLYPSLSLPRLLFRNQHPVLN